MGAFGSSPPPTTTPPPDTTPPPSTGGGIAPNNGASAAEQQMQAALAFQQAQQAYFQNLQVQQQQAMQQYQQSQDAAERTRLAAQAQTATQLFNQQFAQVAPSWGATPPAVAMSIKSGREYQPVFRSAGAPRFAGAQPSMQRAQNQGIYQDDPYNARSSMSPLQFGG